MTDHPHQSASKAPPTRCAVVGVGRMGRHHARVYTELPNARLVGVVDQDAGRRNAIAEKHGCPAFESVSELLDAGVDAVSVAVPTSHHLDAAWPLLEAKVACLIEKPLASDVQQAQRIKEHAERTGAVLQVGHIERYNPAVMALRREGTDSIVPRFIEVHRISPMTFRSVDVGVVFDMMIHDLDVVLMLMGGIEPTEVHASGVSVVTEHEDVCNARLVFEAPQGKCVANITASRLALKTERKVRIVGDDAYVSIDYANKSGVLIRRTANQAQLTDVREALRSGKDLSSLDYSDLVTLDPLTVDDAEPLRLQLEAFLHAVRTGSRPDIDASDGFANVRTAERIVQAVRADW